MTHLSLNAQKENLSIIQLEKMCFPWVCTKLGTDTGIDFSVQPYDEKARNKDGSLTLYPAAFEVQLKSTSEEILSQDLNVGKLNLTVQHLNAWKRRTIPVMIIRYYFEHDTFFYTWIDEVEIKSNQSTQTIELPYKIEKAENDISFKIYQEYFKESVLDKLIPPDIGELVYDPQGISNGMGYLKIDNIRSGRQVAQIIQDGLLQKTTDEMLLRHKINVLNQAVLANGLQIKDGIHLVLAHLKLGEINQSLTYLNYLVNTLKSVEGKILKNVVFTHKFDKGYQDKLNEISFIFYIEFEPNLENDSKVNIVLDGAEYSFRSNQENIYILPAVDFNKINTLNFVFNQPMIEDKSWNQRGHLFRTKISLRKLSFSFYRGIIINGELKKEYSELLISNELKINALSIAPH